MRQFSLFCYPLSFLIFTISFVSYAGEPTVIDRGALAKWVEQIRATQSPFQDYVFDWAESEKNRDLPPELNTDPDKTYVSVEKPLQETIDLENQGDIEKGITYGLEVYSKINASIDQVLETILFRWGKPVGKLAGITYPFDSVFSNRIETLEQTWGEHSYLNRSIRTHGGFAKDIRDDLYLLVRQVEGGGYDLAGGFVKPAGTTSTKTYFMITQLRPLSDGTVSYKVSGRQMGQSYAQLGLEFGRKNFGFNRDRIRNGQKELLALVDELKRTGKIHERIPSSVLPLEAF